MEISLTIDELDLEFSYDMLSIYEVTTTNLTWQKVGIGKCRFSDTTWEFMYDLSLGSLDACKQACANISDCTALSFRSQAFGPGNCNVYTGQKYSQVSAGHPEFSCYRKGQALTLLKALTEWF